MKVNKVKSIYTRWFSNDIRKNLNCRDFLKKRTIQTNSPVFHCAYKTDKNKVNKIVKMSSQIITNKT